MTENPTTADKLPLQEQLTAISREELRSTIRRCHQILWDGGKRSPMAAFGEFCKLAFLKQRDEIETVGSTVANYQFQRKPGETPEQLTARITGYYEQEKSRQPDVFQRPHQPRPRNPSPMRRTDAGNFIPAHRTGHQGSRL